jgi:hypothetical protein
MGVISDQLISGLAGAFVTALGAFLVYFGKRNEVNATGAAATQTQFYKDLMARVGALESEAVTLRKMVESRDAEIYKLRLELETYKVRATLEAELEAKGGANA